MNCMIDLVSLYSDLIEFTLLVQRRCNGVAKGVLLTAACHTLLSIVVTGAVKVKYLVHGVLDLLPLLADGATAVVV